MFKIANRIAGALLLALVALASTPAVGAEEAAPTGVVNVNQAGLDELVLLPRVGPAVASRIVEHREANGPFESKEELMLVRGIGEKTFEGLESWVTLEGKTTLTSKVRSSRSAPAEADGR